MRVFYSGFNLYGQFVNYPNSVAEGFIDFTYNDVIKLEINHSCFIILNADHSISLHGRKNDKTHQIQKIIIPNNSRIIQICCTSNKLLLLTNNSQIFKVDINKCDQLVPQLLSNTIFLNASITKIASGEKVNVALSKDGELYTFSNRLNFKNKDVTDISAGREHCVILDNKGNVYTFGRGSRSQLGHGCLEDESQPKLVEALAGIKIIKIAAGGWHSCAVSAEGDLYVWGWNGNGQLGIEKGNEESVPVMALPHIVDFPNDLNVVDVACGHRHTVVLLENGNLFGAGWNKYHQLGKLEDCKENIYTMTFLYNFSNMHVNCIKCGPWSTAVIC